MPPELAMALDAVTFHQLPEAGGLRDQPAKLMRAMRASLNAYHAYRAYNRDGRRPGEMGAWKKANPDLWDVVKEVERAREHQSNQSPD